jgi:hypothetical protein
MSDERLKYPGVEFVLFYLRVKGELPESKMQTSARDIAADDPPLIEKKPYVGPGPNDDPIWRLTRKGKRVIAELIEQRKAGTTTDSAPDESPNMPPAGKPVSKAKGKPGRKSNAASDAKIAREYAQGLERGEWEGQADYLRKRHPDGRTGSDKDRAWLNSLLARVKRKKG